MRTREHDWRPAIAAALMALAVFAVTLKGTFIYDDTFIVAADSRVSHPSQWGQFWTKGYFPEGIDNLYRPLTSMSYGVQWWLNGDRPWAFHLVNWLLFAACAAAVAELARRMAGVGVGYIAGLLFAVHPIHTEVVAEIVGRADLLCTFFFVLALILLARRPLTLRRVWAIFGCGVLSLLCKEQGLLLPPVLLIFWFCRRWDRKKPVEKAQFEEETPSKTHPKPQNSPAMILTLLVCWTWAGYIFFREWLLPFEWDRSFLDWTKNPMIRAKGWSVWLMPVEILGRYLQLLVVPWKLSVDYGGRVIGWVVHPGDPYLYVGLAGILIWVVLFIWAIRRRAGGVIFCLLGMALSWGMVSNFGVLIGTIFGERLMFLPSVFFLILAAMGLARLRRPVLVPLFTVLLALGILRSVSYAARWNDRLGFYEYSLQQQPDSVQNRLNLAVELLQRGQLDRADRVLAVARRQDPDYWVVWAGSFDVAIRRRQLSEAREYLARAAKLVPNPTVLWARRDALEKAEAEQPSPATAPTSEYH